MLHDPHLQEGGANAKEILFSKHESSPVHRPALGNDDLPGLSAPRPTGGKDLDFSQVSDKGLFPRKSRKSRRNKKQKSAAKKVFRLPTDPLPRLKPKTNRRLMRRKNRLDKRLKSPRTSRKNSKRKERRDKLGKRIQDQILTLAGKARKVGKSLSALKTGLRKGNRRAKTVRTGKRKNRRTSKGRKPLVKKAPKVLDTTAMKRKLLPPKKERKQNSKQKPKMRQRKMKARRMEPLLQSKSV